MDNKTAQLLRENERLAFPLNESDSVQYLSSLDKQLDNLSKIFSSREGGDSIVSFLRVIRRSVQAMGLKYLLTEGDRIDFPLKIASPLSGFPTESDFYTLTLNKNKAEDILRRLPEREEIIGMIRRAILRDDSCVTAQTILERFEFYKYLSLNPIFENTYKPSITFVKRENGRVFETVEWHGIERATALPVFYRMGVTEPNGGKHLHEEGDPNLELIIQRGMQGGMTPRDIVVAVDMEIERLHPKIIEKYTIGPYYDSFTTDDESITALLDSSDRSSILKFTVESVMSERAVPYGNWLDKILRNKCEREIFGHIDYESGMIVPFGMKQVLGGKDEVGNRCRVYGITSEGGIIG